MDIASIKFGGATLKIKHPVTEEPIGLEIDLLAPNDPKIKSKLRRLQDERAKAQMRGKIIPAEDLERKAHDMLVAASVGWRWNGDATFHGEKPEFDMLTVDKLYSEVEWIKTQVDEFMGETKNFLTS